MRALQAMEVYDTGRLYACWCWVGVCDCWYCYMLEWTVYYAWFTVTFPELLFGIVSFGW